MTTPDTYTMREFIRTPRKVSNLLRAGKKITVTNNGVPLFVAVPIQAKPKGARMSDFAHIRIEGKHPKDLSQRVDELVYGK